MPGDDPIKIQRVVPIKIFSMFCFDTVCMTHIRKKRRDPKTNKYARICDLCEDTYLYKKYLKNEMKMEESFAAQESLLEIKCN